MMMKILEAGGVPILTDNLRTADEDNPKGYFELEQVKALKEGQDAWLKDAGGKAVKVISSLLGELPATHRYKVIFMQRQISEVLASQKQMLIRRGEASDGDDRKMAENFQEHLKRVRIWLANQPNMEVLYVSYNDLMADHQVRCGVPGPGRAPGSHAGRSRPESLPPESHLGGPGKHNLHRQPPHCFPSRYRNCPSALPQPAPEIDRAAVQHGWPTRVPPLIQAADKRIVPGHGHYPQAAMRL